MTDKPEQNSPAVVEDYDFLAKEFAALLVSSDLDEDTQKALIDALPDMELEEIVDLIGALEAKYVVGETTELNKDLEAKLAQTTDRFDKKEGEIEADTIKQLEKLAENL